MHPAMTSSGITKTSVSETRDFADREPSPELKTYFLSV